MCLIYFLLGWMETDCRQVSSSGVNFILPRDSNQVLKVFCDQETSGGGWTLIQRRSDGKEDFNQNWAAYKSGKMLELVLIILMTTLPLSIQQ